MAAVFAWSGTAVPFGIRVASPSAFHELSLFTSTCFSQAFGKLIFPVLDQCVHCSFFSTEFSFAQRAFKTFTRRPEASVQFLVSV